MEADFSGYATKTGLKCTDGRTIMPDAFKHNDGMRVPLVWQHGHHEPTNVLGHALLENRPDGVYTYGYFNDTPGAQAAKMSVQHKDITMLSIYASQLVERSKQVFHGAIKEVSLVLSGANPGALIDNVSLAHADGEIETLDDEAIIYTGEILEHTDKSDDNSKDETDDAVAEHADNSEETVLDVYETFTDKQKDVVTYMIGRALENSGVVEHSDDSTSDAEAEAEPEEQSDDKSDEQPDETTDNDTAAGDDTNEGDLNHQEGNEEMTRNVFEQNGGTAVADRPHLTHSQLQTIIEDAQKTGSFKESFLAHAVEYGIENIDFLFPDARAVTSEPDVIGRRMEWVASVLSGAKHSPFSRIKSTAVDLTADEARAKGYVKATLKKEEVIKLLKRVTTPTTIYKKQKLDRDDIVDITDLDVVAWLKAEMRIMLDEELARAVLIGDGREPDDEDKINEEHIRPIAYDDEMYAHQVTLATSVTGDAVVEAIVRARTYYKGTGTPTLYTTDATIIDLLLIKDTLGRRLYPTEADLAAALRVKSIVAVEVMEDVPDLLAVIVSIGDYTLGADKGGSISMFDDFDIDYNQYKYLIETRCSGALTKPKSAVVVRRSSNAVISPTVPAYNAGTHTITIPTMAGVVYQIDGSTVAAGPVVITETTEVEAVATGANEFAHNADTDWTYVYTP